MSKVAFSALWCFVLVLPWDVFTSLPVLGSIPRLVGVVASAVGILHILARRRIRPPSWFHVFAVLFVLWAGVSSFWSIDPQATRARFDTYLQLAVLVWLIWEIAWSPERQRALLQAYVLGAGVAALMTVYSYLSGDTSYPVVSAEGRFTALNQNPNYLGRVFVLGLPMAWYLSLSQRHRHLAWTWQLYIPLGSTATLLTGSRGAFLAGLVALVIIPWTLGRLRLRTKAAVCALAIGSLMFAISFAPEAPLERIGTTLADMKAGSFGGRGAIWQAGLEVAREHPLAGVGAGAFAAAVDPIMAGPRGSHQTFLAILVEDGIVGLLLFLMMVATAMPPLRHLPDLQRKVWIVLLATLAVASMAAGWDYQKDLWLLLGMSAAQAARPTPSSLSSRGGPRREGEVGGRPGNHRLDAVGRPKEPVQGG